MTYNLLRGISHQATIPAVQKILRKGEAMADVAFGEGITNYSNTYAQFPGVTPFVEYLADRHSTERDNIYILDGGMQANTMVFNALGTKKPILTDQFLYDRCLQTLTLLGFTVIGVPMNEEGTDTDALEQLIKKYQPSCFWRNIRYNNPTGMKISMDNVCQTAEICARYQVVHHLDDAYENCGTGITGAEDEGPVNLSHPSLKKTVLVRMTTKEFSPHEKISWIACGSESEIAKRIINLAIASRLNSHYRLQASYYMAMINGDYEKHISWVNNAFYQPRGRSLNKGIEEFFSGFACPRIEDASFFTTLWLKGVSLEQGKQIVDTAADMGVKVTSGIPAIAPTDAENQPELVMAGSYPVGISPTSGHCISVLEKMGGYPVRLAPNACPGENDPYEALKILRAAYDKVT
ncbi:aminotransferase class I/II-fold pyridoxal phosphate-dependent enzyme [Desulfococcaceae bacterium HSG8]|nr:aminotransferase class I/II-fold pyridoxal phosphate-dependent enzyme [Desulfococcaceae bacterium HSG8]